jgi:hypothetical protein
MQVATGYAEAIEKVPHKVLMMALHLMLYFLPDPYINQPKALVTRKDYHVVVTTNIFVNKQLKQLEGNTHMNYGNRGKCNRSSEMSRGSSMLLSFSGFSRVNYKLRSQTY